MICDIGIRLRKTFILIKIIYYRLQNGLYRPRCRSDERIRRSGPCAAGCRLTESHGTGIGITVTLGSEGMQRYSIWSLARNALHREDDWAPVWRSPEPKPRYRVIVVGGGGHGLATAYYLAKEHGIADVAVLEKGWLGGGNTGRNTTIVRSNYLCDASAAIYEHAVKLWEGLSQELNYNVMFSQRGVMHLAHSLHDLHEVRRRGHANRLNGVDSEFLEP